MAAPIFNVLDGAGVIGGTKILLQSGKANVLLDFGTNFWVWNQYFEEYLKPRSSRGLLDAAELGLLPPIPSLYRADYMPPGVDPWRGAAPATLTKLQVDAILVTHAHLDHCGYLSYVNPSVPIVSTVATAFLMKAIQDTSKGDLEKEICYCVPRQEKDGLLRSGDFRKFPATQRRFLTPGDANLSADAASFWTNPLGSRQLIATTIETIAAISGCALLAYPVDHSIPGCAAFAFETDGGWVVYTGDVRLHGENGQLTRVFAEQVARLKPRLLFCEGTRVSRLEDEVLSEVDVRERALTVVKGTPGLVIADFGSRNLERLQTFRQVALECGRQLVLMTKDIHLLKAHFLATGLGIDPVTDPALLLYQESKSSESTADRTIYATYQSKLINPADIAKEQDRFIVCFSFWDLNELVEIRPIRGSVYIYSSSEAYDEEQKADVRRLRNWLKHFDVTPLGVPDPETGRPLPGETGLHASGHASATDLLELIETMDPEMLVPVHTERPEFFLEHCGGSRNVLIPKALEALPV